MSKLYRVKAEHESEWKDRMDGEKYDRLSAEPFDIDVIVDLAREWDVALQIMLNQVEVVQNDT